MAVIIEEIPPERTYPWAGQYITKEHTTVVLFTEPNTGLCIQSTDPDNMKDYNRYNGNWTEELFKPIKLTIT